MLYSSAHCPTEFGPSSSSISLTAGKSKHSNIYVLLYTSSQWSGRLQPKLANRRSSLPHALEESTACPICLSYLLSLRPFTAKAASAPLGGGRYWHRLLHECLPLCLSGNRLEEIQTITSATPPSPSMQTITASRVRRLLSTHRPTASITSHKITPTVDITAYVALRRRGSDSPHPPITPGTLSKPGDSFSPSVHYLGRAAYGQR